MADFAGGYSDLTKDAPVAVLGPFRYQERAGGYSDLVKDVPVAVLGPFRYQERAGTLSKVDNVGGGGGGEVVRTVPKLVRSEP